MIKVKERAVEKSQIKAVYQVLRLPIIKPLNMSWNDFGEVVRMVRYRAKRFANLFMSERYTNRETFPKASELNRRLFKMLDDEGKLGSVRVASAGSALPTTVTDALFSKLKAETIGDKWRQVLTGECSLPTYRQTIPVPTRGGHGRCNPLRWSDEDDGYVFEPRMTLAPYPKLLVGPGGKKAEVRILAKKLLKEHPGWEQKSYEIKEDRNGKWWLHLTYSKPAIEQELDASKVVGVHVAFSTPLVATCDGNVIGKHEFSWLREQIQSVRNTTDRRRRSIQMGGRKDNAVRAGRGVKHKLGPTVLLQGRVDSIEQRANHIMSSMVVEFALVNGAGIIQMEDYASLQDKMVGTFLSRNWRYHQLQEQIKYKAKTEGIKVDLVNPKYIIKRCPHCGHIQQDYDKLKSNGVYQCVNEACKAFGKSWQADRNAAMNLEIIGIDEVIQHQLDKEQACQGRASA